MNEPGPFGAVGTALRTHVKTAYERGIEVFASSLHFSRLESGDAPKEAYDALLLRVAESHLLSGHFVAFGFAIAPPKAAVTLQHNLEEELGTDGGTAHPDLLVRLLRAAGLADLEAQARRNAQLKLRDRVMEPLFYGSLREVGLAALVEIVAFEFMLSRLSSRFARMLRTHRSLGDVALEWFTHHAEVDAQHAEEGLDAIAEFVDYYELEIQEASDIVDSTLEENVYLKHYFGVHAAHVDEGIA